MPARDPFKFQGDLFVAYSNDHWPRHVHGFAAETEVIVDSWSGGRPVRQRAGSPDEASGTPRR